MVASVAGLVLALSSAPALGATVSVSGSTLSYVAASAEVNGLQIIRDDGSATFTVIDSGAPVTVGSGCTSVGPGRASCSAASVTAISVHADDMDDVVGVFGPAPAS
jgi:hypothetical protein